MEKIKETRLTVVLDPELKNEAKSRAYAEGTNLKQKVISLLKGWLYGKG